MQNQNNIQNTNNGQSNIDEIDLKELIYKVLNKWYVFVITGIVCLGLSVLYILRTAPEYSTTASVLVRSDNSMDFLSSNMGAASSLFDKAKLVDDEMEILRSKTILNDMVEQLGLHTDIYYKKRFGVYNEMFRNEPLTIIHPEGYLNSMRGVLTIEVKKSKKGIWNFEFTHEYNRTETEFEYKTKNISSPIKTPWGNFVFIENENNIDQDYPNYKVKFITRTRKSNIERYSKLITVGLTNKKTNVMNISMISPNPYKAESIINKLIDLYNEDAIEDKNKASMQMSSFITERLSLLERELSVVEQKVQDYRTKNNVANISEQSKMVIEAVNEYDKRVLAVDMQTSAVELIENHIKNTGTTDLIPSNTGIEDATLANLIIAYNEQVLEYLRLTRSTNEANPYVSQLKDKIRLTKDNITQTIINVKKSLTLKKQDLLAKSREIEQQIASVPKIEREYIEVAREQEIKRSLYVFLLQKREETQLSLATATTSAKIIDQAYTAELPVAPRKKLVLLVAFVFAAFIGCAYVYLDTLINDKIKDRKMLKQTTSLPILGVIPFEKGAGHIVVKQGVISPISESFKYIRTNIPFILKKPEHKVILVTSSIPTEGKSFVSINIAMSLALLNKKIALLGMDIRKPRLKEYLNISKKIGVVDYIITPDLTIEDIKETYPENPNLDIFISGTIPPDPSELLANERLGQLFDKMRKIYDYIIVDSAPIGMVSDTFTLNAYSDSVIYVARCGVTPKEFIQNLEIVTNGGQLSNVSIILNGDKKGQIGGYGNYGNYGNTKVKNKFFRK